MCWLDVVFTSQNDSPRQMTGLMLPDQEIRISLIQFVILPDDPKKQRPSRSWKAVWSCVETKLKEMNVRENSFKLCQGLRQIQLSCLGSNIYLTRLICLQFFVSQANFLGGFGCLNKGTRFWTVVLIEDFSVFILRLSWFQTSKLLLRSPISSVIQRGQMWCLWAAVYVVREPDLWLQKIKYSNTYECY